MFFFSVYAIITMQYKVTWVAKVNIYAVTFVVDVLNQNCRIPTKPIIVEYFHDILQIKPIIILIL